MHLVFISATYSLSFQKDGIMDDDSVEVYARLKPEMPTLLTFTICTWVKAHYEVNAIKINFWDFCIIVIGQVDYPKNGLIFVKCFQRTFMTAWSYCAMAPLNDGSGAEAMRCSQLSKKIFLLINDMCTLNFYLMSYYLDNKVSVHYVFRFRNW